MGIELVSSEMRRNTQVMLSGRVEYKPEYEDR